MTKHSPFASARLSIAARLALASGGIILAAMLATASWLRPSSAGRGTHQQLGLPECTFLTVVGQPCPSCGMTTAWAHAVRGQLWSAMAANAGGALLALAAVAGAPWLLTCAARGRWFWQPSETQMIWGGLGWTLVMLTDWAVRLLMAR